MYNNSDELVIVLNAVESTCAVKFYTVVDTSRSPVHNTPCPLHWVRDNHEGENFSDSSLYHRFESENLKFPFFCNENGLTWRVKCENLTTENRREFMR